MISREDCLQLDRRWPFAETRRGFDLPEGLIYLDGNSLGPVLHGTADHLADVVAGEWRSGLIRSWNPLPGGGGDWIGLARRVGDRIAPLIGAGPGEVHVGDSTSVSLFKTMAAAARMRPDRHVILIEEGTFPTDAYIASGLSGLTGLEVRFFTGDPVRAIGDDVALVSLTHVDFRTGRAFDMAEVTAAAHRVGALVQWDLCHSVGAIDVDVSAADFAVGCTYKYLNGGPGSPAFIWVRRDHLPAVHQPITGWMGHAAPFEMTLEHTPAAGIARMASGTPPILALSALEHALTAFEGLSMSDVRAASLSLTELFMALLDEQGFDVVTPRSSARGSQVSFRHPHAYGIVQALIGRGVIGDYRADPSAGTDRDGIARFGFAPLYISHADVWDAAEQLRAVMRQEEYADPAYSSRNAVT